SAAWPPRKRCAGRMRRSSYIDRQNHHLFQPLLYQGVTSVLSPGQIASPIGGILGKQRSTTVILGEVSVDAERRRVFVDSVDRADVGIDYDYLRFSRPARATATSATTNSNSSPPGSSDLR